MTYMYRTKETPEAADLTENHTTSHHFLLANAHKMCLQILPCVATQTGGRSLSLLSISAAVNQEKGNQPTLSKLLHS